MDNLYRKGHLTATGSVRPTGMDRAHHAEHSAALMREALSIGEDSEAVLTHFVGAMSEDEVARLYLVMNKRPRSSAR